MKAALVVFDGMTMLDFIGFYDAITRMPRMGFLPDMTWNVCARTDQVADERGLRLLPDRVGGSLEGYDLLYVPGGMGTRKLQHDARFVEWLQTASGAKIKVSVCTGALSSSIWRAARSRILSLARSTRKKPASLRAATRSTPPPARRFRSGLPTTC